MPSTTAAAAKSNSSLGVMLMHTTYYRGGTGTNPRRESFMEYLVSLNLDILNQGNKPTFVVRNTKKVTDLTSATHKIGNLVNGMYLMSHLLSDQLHMLSNR
jgi:hypothetical protein